MSIEYKINTPVSTEHFITLLRASTRDKRRPLADKAYQNCGIGKQIQIITPAQLGTRCKLILISAPATNEYYKHIGFSKNERCWVLEAGQKIRSS
jgi:hypothetical protein